MLKRQRPFDSIGLSLDHAKRSNETGHLKVIAQLLRTPNLSMLGFQCLSLSLLGIDFGGHFSSDCFCGIVHE